MKILNIKQFKVPKSNSGPNTALPPEHGQLVNVKGVLTQFVVAETNCANCHFTTKNCERIACGSGHYAEVKLSTPPVWQLTQA